MSPRKLSDSDVEMLIELWRNGRSLWDVTFPKYSNAIQQKAALFRIKSSDEWHGYMYVTTSLTITLTILFYSVSPYFGTSLHVQY